MKRCRVCGKEYEACRSARRGDGVFRWREVACCPEHGEVYLAQVMASRGSISDEDDAATDFTAEEEKFFTDDFDESDDDVEIDTK